MIVGGPNQSIEINRAFACTGDGKVPDAKALGHWRDWDKPSGRSNRAIGAWCKEEGATEVETNIHTSPIAVCWGTVRAC